MNGDNRGVGALLSYHLQLLNLADAALRIEHDDTGSRYIRKTSHSSLTGISGGCSQDNDFILHMILLCRGSHQIRKNGQCHVLEGDGTSVEQLQIISAVRLDKRSDLLRVKLAVVSVVDAVTQLFLGEVC